MVIDSVTRRPGVSGQDAGPAIDKAHVPKRFAWSVRTKGMVVFAGLIVYSILIALFVFHQKNLLLREFEGIQKSLEVDSALKQVDVAAFDAVMTVFANIDAQDRAAGMSRIHAHHQLLMNKHAALAALLPESKPSLRGLDEAMGEAARNPSNANMNRLIRELVRSKNELTRLSEEFQEKRRRTPERYRNQSDSVALTTLMLGVLGLGFLGVIAGLFFRRLTDDLRLLQARALDIVKGYRGEPIPIRRQDEVGQLMEAVNHMASALDIREKELMVERQKYFHQEKMAAIGTLAAGLAHEIGNPIAAISGIAQEMSERRDADSHPCGADYCRPCHPELILIQTARLAAITREISEFASPQTAEPQLLDLNALLLSTSTLLRYDKRLERVDLQLDLDRQLPAVYGVADQLSQVIMNLLINAMDALEEVRDRQPAIKVSTYRDGERACMAVEDNGHGMEKDIVGRVFEAFFTTKPAGKGTGLGLALCYSIM